MNSSTTLASRTGVVWSKLNQGGNYSCIATNEVGTESKMFYVSLTAFRVCVDLCDCHSSANTFEVQNIFRCTGKNSTHILNSIPTTTTQLRLGGNEISELPEKVFSGLTSLRWL
ncbi:insulin-like growth factor-binding protein complex acid labile subunit [Montipora foliosa]|uniref:insulin-like growth factor-binding protein complex acid labile subunit n=1 Tax=Montipora foliosa TaxID=591990 RepID=UPI0035F132C5